MTTYRIIGKTNPWIAQRDPLFNGKTEIIIERGLDLSEAKTLLRAYFCKDYDTYFANWANIMSSNLGKEYAYHYKQGDTYTYEYDSRYFSIEVEEYYEVRYSISANGVEIASGTTMCRDEQDEQEFIWKMESRYWDECDGDIEVELY